MDGESNSAMAVLQDEQLCQHRVEYLHVPRYPRLHIPGAVVHAISRFANRAFRIAGAAERALVLDAIPIALRRTDWQLLGFALMSSHLHFVLRAGGEPPWRWLSALHSRIARRLNLWQRGFGPVMAERGTTVVLRPERAGLLLAYVHNNPVRAGVVLDPAASTWTSHRAYVGLDVAPPWLDAVSGLSLAGFDASPAGRRAFHEFVVERASESPEPELSGATLPIARAALRRTLGLPVEISSPAVDDEVATMHVELAQVGAVSPPPRWNGDLAELADAVCASRGVTIEELRSPSQRRVVTNARRVFVVAGHLYLRRRLNELAAAVGIATCTASRLVATAGELRDEARAIAERVRGMVGA